MNKKILFVILFFSILFSECDRKKVFLTPQEENLVIKTSIDIERDSSFGMINGAKYGSTYLLNDHFNDSIYLDSNVIYKLDKNISFQDIQKQYQRALNKRNKLITDSFNLIHAIHSSNKTPSFLSFSKPIKYLKYYILNFYYFSWSSGYKSLLIFEKTASGRFKLVYRSVYELV